jgi:hypothetical protein
MSLQLDFEWNQIAIANPEAVTFTSVATAGNVDVAILDAGFYRAGQGIVEGGPSLGAYQRFDAVFSIRMSLLTGVGGAKPGDEITTDDATTWTVLSASPGVISGIWQLHCVFLTITGLLGELGTLSRPTLAQDAAGRQNLGTYNPIATDVPCWVEPMDATAGDTFDRRTMALTYKAYLQNPVAAQTRDRWTVGGLDYTITKVSLGDRLDRLQELDLTRVS